MEKGAPSQAVREGINARARNASERVKQSKKHGNSDEISVTVDVRSTVVVCYEEPTWNSDRRQLEHLSRVRDRSDIEEESLLVD